MKNKKTFKSLKGIWSKFPKKVRKELMKKVYDYSTEIKIT